jgi:predicted nucleotidyltransferase component of viral defense system
VDISLIRHLALKSGLSLNFISKDERLSEVLRQLNEVFGDEVILKGGTALNRIHLAKLGVARFSEDIDLDHRSDQGLDGKIAEIGERMKLISGFDVQGPRLLHRTLRFDCYFQNELGVRDRVKVEFYLSSREYVNASKELIRSPFLDSNPTMFNVYSREDLLAKKLVALYNRMEGKDIYDSFYGLKLDLDEKKFDGALKIMTGFYKIEEDVFKGARDKLERAKGRSKAIRDSTNHYIPKDLRPDWRIIMDSLASELSSRERAK